MITDFSPVPEASNQPVVPMVRQRERPAVSAQLYQAGCWRVIEASGDLDIQVVPRLRALIVGNPLHVVFDLCRVTFLDAGILGILVAARANQGLAHGAVRIAAPSPRVRRLIAITQLEAVLPAFETLDQAVAGHEAC